MKKYGFSILCLSMLYLFSCLGDPETLINVILYDEITQLPIEGVKVSFHVLPERIDIKYTDEEGIAGTMWSGGPQNIQVTFNKPGYIDKSIIVEESNFNVYQGDNSDVWIEVYLTPLLK